MEEQVVHLGSHQGNVGEVVRRLTEVIKRRRRSLGISQQMLADSAGLDRGYLVSIEHAKRNPSIITLVQIAVALSMPASELVGLAEQMANDHDSSSGNDKKDPN